MTCDNPTITIHKADNGVFVEFPSETKVYATGLTAIADIVRFMGKEGVDVQVSDDMLVCTRCEKADA